MTKIVVLLSAVVMVLAMVEEGRAHNSTWYWSRVTAESTLEDEGILEWEDGTDTVDLARCYARAGWKYIVGKRGIKLYRHFNCRVWVTTDLGEEQSYWIKFHVLSRFGWDYTWLRWQ
jgi:hypothetical protein